MLHRIANGPLAVEPSSRVAVSNVGVSVVALAEVNRRGDGQPNDTSGTVTVGREGDADAGRVLRAEVVVEALRKQFIPVVVTLPTERGEIRFEANDLFVSSLTHITIVSPFVFSNAATVLTKPAAGRRGSPNS